MNTDEARWYQRIGPGLITACVVIGPGSILTSSNVGASQGYQMIWVVLVAVLFMLVFTTLGARLGVITHRSAGSLIAEQFGRPAAMILGMSVFFISAAFQFGNNLGVRSAFQEYESWLSVIPGLSPDVVMVLFNGLAISFLFLFHNLYRVIERLMMALVGLMLLSFAVNMIFAAPPLREFAAGFLPPIPGVTASGQGTGVLDISLLGLVGTTFVITAAFFQSYLVQQKGWTERELRSGMIDARVGAVLMALITIMLMSTAAAELRGQELKNVGDVAAGLRPTFGSFGHALFCLGLFAAAYSSFTVNSMIGGFILADSLGLGARPTDLWPRVFTVIVLLTGMSVALLKSRLNFDTLPAIVAAQAVTVVASPAVAAALWALTARRDVMGDRRNGTVLNAFAALGFLLLLAMAAYTATQKVWPAIQTWMG